MSDITWRDQYDGPDDLADRLDDMIDRAARRGHYDDATTLFHAAQALRDLQDELARRAA